MPMTELTYRRADPRDLLPLAEMLTDPDAMTLVNPNAKYPFDPLEWQEKWLNEPTDAAYYIDDETGTPVGFFALREGIGPEVRHLVYVFVTPEARGGAGADLTRFVEEAASDLRALSVSLKVELDNDVALSAYRSAGYEELGRSNGYATMRRDLG